MSGHGYHWSKCPGGGSGGSSSGLALAVIAAVVLIGSGAVSAAASAIVSLLVTIAIVLGSLLGLAVLAGIALLVHRARSDRPGRPIAARLMYPVPPAARPELEVPDKPAIEPARETHLHFHVSAAELAAIMRHHLKEDS